MLSVRNEKCKRKEEKQKRKKRLRNASDCNESIYIPQNESETDNGYYVLWRWIIFLVFLHFVFFFPSSYFPLRRLRLDETMQYFWQSIALRWHIFPSRRSLDLITWIKSNRRFVGIAIRMLSFSSSIQINIQ